MMIVDETVVDGSECCEKSCKVGTDASVSWVELCECE